MHPYILINFDKLISTNMEKLISCLIILAAFNMSASVYCQKKSKEETFLFTEPKIQGSFQFMSVGKNDYFILEPGYQSILEGQEGKDLTRLIITVLNETRIIGNIETRIVEENESVNGKTAEISRNFFAFCKQTNSVYYFGEEVDIYRNGKIVDHEGSWVAEGNNKPGMAMPGLILTGARYYQEIAPGVAMDRAEIISDNDTFETPLGKFNNVLTNLHIF